MLVVSISLVVLFAGLLTAGLTSNESLFQALGNLTEVVHLVEAEYVDELEPDVLALSLDAGILESIDPWAAVIRDEQIEAYERVFSEPPAYGLGLSLRLGSAAVRYPFPGSPAAEAGLAAWEVIEKIDGVYTRGQPLWQIALDLADREARGEIVTLTVMDRQVNDRREVELVPGEWTPTHANLETVADLRVLTIDSLTAGSAASVAELVAENAPDIVDLRGLVWGLESEAIEVADLFVAEGTLASWEGREAGSEVVEATEVFSGRVPVVLISNDTEGAGEVLASALKRSGSELLGQVTMGHAPHMQLVRKGTLNLWIPVGRWLDPEGRPIRGDGLEPDEAIDPPGEDEEGDPVLDRAVEKLTPEDLAEAA
jgi:C-terminal processing protease CtpA/Prc